MSNPSVIFNKLIDMYGIDVNVRRRTETVDDDGDISYTYPETIRVRAQVSELTGYTEEWESPGLKEDADYLITFKNGTKVDVGDMITWTREGSYNTIQCEVITRLYRKTGSRVDYIETLSRERVAS